LRFLTLFGDTITVYRCVYVTSVKDYRSSAIVLGVLHQIQ
jgi:hypothetical protein